MERYLLGSALLLGVVGWLCGLLLPSGNRRAGNLGDGVAALPRTDSLLSAVWLVAGGLPILVFLATLPTSGYFSAGQGWGRGFLVGGLLSLLASWTMRRSAAPGDSALRAQTPCALALVAVSVSLLFLRANGGIVDALVGAAMGWLAVALTLLLLGGATEEDAPAAVLGAGFAVTLCAVAALGVYRGALMPGAPKGLWSAAGVAFGAGVPFALLLGALAARASGDVRSSAAGPPKSVAFGLRLAASSLLVAGLGALLATKVLHEPKMVPVVLGGLALGPIALWVLRSATQTDEDAPAVTLPFVGLPPLALVLMASGFMAAYQLLQGFGVGVLLLSAWLSAALLLASPTGRGERDTMPPLSAAVPRLIALLLFGVVLLVYRVFATRWSDLLRGVTLTDHYAFFGFLVGAALPGVIAGMGATAAPPAPNSGGARVPVNAGEGIMPSPSDAEPPAPPELGAGGASLAGRASLLSLFLAGALCLAAPGVILVLFGAKCALALLAGLALGSVPAFVVQRGGNVTANVTTLLLPGLLAVAMALALAQFSGRVVPLGDLTRAGKIKVVGGAAAVVAVLLVASELGGDGRRRRGAVVVNARGAER